MFSKINLLGVVCGHYSSFGNENGNGKWKDYVLFCVIPLLIGTGYWCGLKWRGLSVIPCSCWMSAVSANAILVPLILTLLTCLYSSRDKYSGNARVLLKYLCENSAYCVLVALSVMLYAVGVEIFDARTNFVVNAVFVSMGVHFMLTLLMVMKRFHNLFVIVLE